MTCTSGRISSGVDAMSCHLVVVDEAEMRKVVVAATDAMKANFGITHATIQVEDQALREADGEEKF